MKLKTQKIRQLLTIVMLILAVVSTVAAQQKWTAQKANDWYKNQPFLVGGNYNPATAINELEMWQADTFDPQRIDLEFGWAGENRDEHDARFSPRFAVETGFRRIHETP